MGRKTLVFQLKQGASVGPQDTRFTIKVTGKQLAGLGGE